MMDVRKPIGLLFFIIGAVLILYATIDPQITVLELVGENRGDLSLNLNLVCGMSMLVFGVLMLLFSYGGRISRSKAVNNAGEHEKSESPGLVSASAECK